MRDLMGKTFGALRVVELTDERHHGCRVWLCQCVCGQFTRLDTGRLQGAQVKSCGCRATVVKHGESRKRGGVKQRTVEYRTWEGMKQRCYNPRHPRFADWGGRGITVCERWRDSFDAFVADMGRRPSSRHSIDRIDNNGPYSQDNCRWATAKEQQSNTRPKRARRRSAW